MRKQGTGKTVRAQLVNGTAPKTLKTRAKLCGCREVTLNDPIIYTTKKEIIPTSSVIISELLQDVGIIVIVPSGFLFLQLLIQANNHVPGCQNYT